MREPTMEELRVYNNFRRDEAEFLEIRRIRDVFYPEAVRFSTDFISEYNDEGGYDLMISGPTFWDNDDNRLEDEREFTPEEWPEVLERMKAAGMNTIQYNGEEHTYKTFYFELYDEVYSVFDRDEDRETVEFDLDTPFQAPEGLRRLYLNESAIRSEYVNRLINSA